jgi:type IV pilus assembly protein PilY1
MTNLRANFIKWGQPALAGLLLALILFKAVPLLASTSDYTMSQSPMYLGANEPPLMMMVMSRDEQLFNRAYSDYTDLDSDGTIDTTYTDSFDYSGYFDSNLCYTYSSSVFKASAAATGTYTHQCSGKWSGNFLNWVTMSRLDLLRYVLYGGKRSTDTVTSSGGYQVILERAYIPNDSHSWVKVYSGSDISDYTPYSSTTSFCNTSLSTSGAPLMRVATGTYTEWAATAVAQCVIQSTVKDSNAKYDVPSSVTDVTVRVDVCGNSDTSLREAFCRSYSDGTYTYYRPAGLLQQYGESGKLRFGMISGSYDLPRAGGVLRRNIGRFAGNNSSSYCASSDEVNMQNGRFCYLISTSSSSEGIVKSLDNFMLTTWSGSAWSDCNASGILNRSGYSSGAGSGWLVDPGSSASGSYKCSAWGNPLAEMYAEALKYIAGGSKTTGFNSSTSTDSGMGLPVGITWYDPYTTLGYSYCSSCSILILSSGLPSFDWESIPTVTGASSTNVLGTDAVTATNAVGSNEGINGTSVYVGRDVSTSSTLTTIYSDLCQSTTLTSLGYALGICPGAPSTEGSYRIAGLAYKAATKDLRPDLVSTDGKSSSYYNSVKTYAVQMAESLPKFEIPVPVDSSYETITLSPLCQGSLVTSATTSSASLRTCSLVNVGVGKTTSTVSPYYVYGRNLTYDSSGKLIAGSYKLTWDNSPWGLDHDNDIVTMITFCVGSACQTSGTNSTSGYDICWRASTSGICGSSGTPTVGSSQVLVRIEQLSAYAGTGILSGFAVTGSTADALYRGLNWTGNDNGSYITTKSSVYSGWSAPQVYRFSPSGSTTSVLENPLWYAAKYGDFTDSNSNGVPDDGEWDSSTSGTPDGYFLANDPSKLKSRLKEIFEAATSGEVSVTGGTSGNVVDSSSFSVVASFTVGSDNDWVGDVKATSFSSGSELWSAATKLDAMTWSDRTIFTAITPTILDSEGAVSTGVSTGELTASNIPGSTWKAKMAALGLDTTDQGTVDWLGSTAVDTLLNYLKGTSNSSLRTRSSLLGDIVSSAPAIALTSDDYGWYSAWSGTTYASLATSYKTFLTSKESTTPAIYVGANDGMLHAFNASTSSSGGTELFAFVPYSARLHLGELANPDYSHRYYVDGPVSVGDAYYSNAWHTVVVGSTGAGGAETTNASTLPQGSVFALNVTDPSSVSSSNVLWELSGQNDGDLGQVTGSAVIVPVKSGSGIKFVAIFGNGVNSANGNPVLYVVDIGTGAVLSRLSPSSTAYQGKNGIINVAAAALENSSGLADTVYAGDLRGNIWKFDLSSSTASDWSVSLSGKPLFQAVDEDGNEQPITGGLLLKGSSDAGMMVYFGTGRYFASGDVSNTSVQSLYGIRDDLSTTISGRSALVEQTLTSSTSSVSGYSVRNVTSNTVNYSTKRGWYVDLEVDAAAGGERFIGTPYLSNGKVYFTTYTPTEGSDCSGGGENWEYALSATTGGGALSGLTNSSGTSICSDTCGAVQVNSSSSSSGSTSVAPITSVTLVRTSSDTSSSSTSSTGMCKMSVTTAGTATGIYVAAPCGRQSWRQLR